MTTTKDKSQDEPYSATWENGYCVVRDANAPEGNKIMMMVPDDMHWLAERLNAAYAAGQAAQWISVEERLPDHPDKVLALCRGGTETTIQVLRCDHPVFDALATHWMPLPEPPTNP